LRLALERDEGARRALIRLLAPVIHVRVARVVERHRRVQADLRQRRQQIEDFTQEVFVTLFRDDARALRAWVPERGLSLLGYVGMIAEHTTMGLLRSGRRNPWRDELFVDGEEQASLDTTPPPDAVLHSRDLLLTVVARMRAELTPKGLELFDRLIVNEEPVEAVCAATGLNRDAVYAWRSRLGKLARKIASEVEHASDLSDSVTGRVVESERSL
jgi:RNA polymerase sigma-70 factor (ECF subfamily)